MFFQLQEHTVQIPEGLDCPDCTIRLTRQAAEWGDNYKFLSCADVEIVPSNVRNKPLFKYQRRIALTIISTQKFVPNCGKSGSPLESGCSCAPTYHGEFCQYKNDCETDRDCSNNGIYKII